MMKNNICVYQHKKLNTDEIFYIGIGSIKRAYVTNTRSKYWKRIVNKHGYKVEILFENLTRMEACQIEQYLIKYYGRRDLKLGTLVNMTDGGDGGLNQMKSKKGIEKLRKTWLGRNHTQETIEKLRNIHLGKKLSEEHKEKLRIAHLGKKHNTENRKKLSKETKLKMSLSKTGSKNIRSIKVINIITLEIFDTITEAAEKLKIPLTTFYAHLNGLTKVNKTNCVYYD